MNNNELVAELTANELNNMLTNAVIFTNSTAKDSMNCVQIKAHGGDLKGCASDRYQAVRVLAEAQFVHPNLVANLESAKIKELCKVLKACTKSVGFHAMVNIYALTGEKGELSALKFVLPDETIEIEHCDTAFAQIDLLFKERPYHTCDMLILNPAHLANFAKVKRVDGADKGAATVFFNAAEETKPMEVRRGDWFQGMVMPAKTSPFDGLFSNRFTVPVPLSERAEKILAA